MILTAAITSLICAALLIAWLWRPRGRAPAGSRMLLAAYIFFGAWAFWFGLYAAPGEEPAWFAYWKPTVIYWVLAAILIAAPRLGGDYPVKVVVGAYFVLSNKQWRWMNWGVAALCALLGAVNLIVAFTSSAGNWEGFKYSCMMNLLFIILLRLNFATLDIVSRVFIYLYGRVKALFP